MDFHMIHYTQIIWEEVAFIWKVTGKAVAIFMTGTVDGWLWCVCKYYRQKKISRSAMTCNRRRLCFLDPTSDGLVHK